MHAWRGTFCFSKVHDSSASNSPAPYHMRPRRPGPHQHITSQEHKYASHIAFISRAYTTKSISRTLPCVLVPQYCVVQTTWPGRRAFSASPRLVRHPFSCSYRTCAFACHVLASSAPMRGCLEPSGWKHESQPSRSKLATVVPAPRKAAYHQPYSCVFV